MVAAHRPRALRDARRRGADHVPEPGDPGDAVGGGGRYGTGPDRRDRAGAAAPRAGERVVAGARRPIEPRPLQPGGPPIWAGSLAPAAIRRAARWADGLCAFSFGPSIEETAGAFDTARTAWRDAGRPVPELTTSFWSALGPGARAQRDQYLRRYLDFLGPALAERLLPTVRVTSPERLRDARLHALRDLGTDEAILVPTTLDPDEVDRVADLAAGL